MAKLGDSIQTADYKNEKHVPVISLPSIVKPGEPLEISISVGKEIPHPNTSEHFIAWIELFYKPEGGKFAYHLGRAEFLAHGATTEGPNTITCNAEPHAIFKVKLDKPGQLIATSWCNIHGLWESSADLKS
jgi:superoxide reductase